MTESDTRNFTGMEPGPDGKIHNIHRVTCNLCGEVLREMHMNCCGYSSCGFGQMGPHKCKDKS